MILFLLVSLAASDDSVDKKSNVCRETKTDWQDSVNTELTWSKCSMGQKSAPVTSSPGDSVCVSKRPVRGLTRPVPGGEKAAVFHEGGAIGCECSRGIGCCDWKF